MKPSVEKVDQISDSKEVGTEGSDLFALYTWGQNESAQCSGHIRRDHVSRPKRLKHKHTIIHHVVARAAFNLIVGQGGRVYVWGSFPVSDGKGGGEPYSRGSVKTLGQPTVLVGLKNLVVTNLACRSDGSCIALTEEKGLVRLLC